MIFMMIIIIFKDLTPILSSQGNEIGGLLTTTDVMYYMMYD